MLQDHTSACFLLFIYKYLFSTGKYKEMNIYVEKKSFYSANSQYFSNCLIPFYQNCIDQQLCNNQRICLVRYEEHFNE